MRIYITFVCFILIGGTVSTQSSSPTPLVNRSIVGSDAAAPSLLSIPIGSGGTLDFTSLTFVKKAVYLEPQGAVVNNTDRDLRTAQLEVLAYDKNGRRMWAGERLTMRLHGLKRGERVVLNIANLILTPRDDTSAPAKVELRYLTSEPWTHLTFRLKSPVDAADMAFEDSLIAISFAKNLEKEIQFELKNKTSEPITIDWNSVAYVDVESNAHRVMHKGIKFVDREHRMATSLIPPLAKLTDFIFPIDLVEWSSISRDWERLPLFPRSGVSGRTFSVFLPLVINGTAKNYNFVFALTVVDGPS